MATKLHEILAVEGDLDATQKKIVEETIATFSKKPEHFLEIVTELTMFDSKDEGQNTTEHKAMVTTVGDKLDWTAKAVAKYLDVVLQKEKTNQTATADLIVDGKTIAVGVPATMLLGLESKLRTLRDVYSAIPTLDPGKDWVKDEAAGAGVWRIATPTKRLKTAKTIRHKVLYEATKEHPAQIEKWNEDVPTGQVIETRKSGMLSPAEKSDLLERLDNLIRGVKKARQRANTAEVVKDKIGDVLFRYIHTGTAA